MTNRTLIGLVIGFAVMTVSAVFVYWQPSFLTTWRVRPGYQELGIETPISTESLLNVTVSQQETNSTTITKTNDQWLVNGKNADPKQLNQLVTAINELKIDSTVSTNPANFSKYSLTDNLNLVIKLETKNKSYELVLGDAGTQAKTFYSLSPDKKIAYLVRSDLRDLVIRSPDDWRNKTIVELNPEEITKVVVTSPTETVMIAKSEAGWTAQTGSKTTNLGQATAERMLSSFAPLKADGFVAEKDQPKFATLPRTTVQVIGQNEKELASLVLADQADKVWIQAQGKSDYFVLSSAGTHDFVLKARDLF